MAETILFTGFPGFIGMRLLPRILELKPHARIECLVQEKFLDVARQAVATLERKHGHTRSRIDLVVGDITVRELSALGIECPSLAEYVPQLVAFYRGPKETVRRSAMI